MLNKILKQEEFSKADIIELLSIKSEAELIILFENADKIRKKFLGDEVHLRGIIEFSNNCLQHCFYCGLRNENSSIKRYRMNREEILKTAALISECGVRTIVLQSGEDHFYTTDFISEIIFSIKKKYDCAITLSLGERNFNEYKEWFEAGADRYLLKHETGNPKLYSLYHQGDLLLDRLNHLTELKNIGYQIGSGNLIGLPKQTIEDVADDIIICRELDVDMASFSPFISSPGTPFGKSPNASVKFTLQVMAVARIVLKNVHIPATTALATLDKFGREKGLKAGANVIMPNFTPFPYREDYQIYPDKKCINDNPKACTSCLKILIEGVGRKISNTRGNSLKIKKMSSFADDIFN
jgi:biotin synthase